MEENINSESSPGKGSVLITGGSGLIGRYLTSLLLSEGYKVSHLSRNTNQFGRVRVFRWDPEKGVLDPVVFGGIDFIIHLAGANIGEKRWSAPRRKEIENSRVDSAKLIYKVISENNISLKAFISASAIGYYGSVTSDKIYKEEDEAGNDFLGTVCRKWEEAAELFASTGSRVVKIRTGVVLEKSDSALGRYLKPAKIGIFPTLGTGRQYMPWIHIEDLCYIYIKAIEDNKLSGAYNAVSPLYITQKEFIINLSQAMNQKSISLPVPSLLLKILLGEMSSIVLKGSRITPQKLINSGFTFRFSDITEALNSVLR